ncbi:helix-turn-helix domain-containing protein [Stappia sp. ES.058]|uniref:helix-turn-helix domain-containing protein n=1 Tax=Stappia sp. ES.058 TaxID=1881061 RepID=UPI00087AC119|nr:helix-turn-helix domain-containing protein [Stappia sp. ES.058]SDT96803.1 dnaA protein helix-turn-helix [Stappia sp. ES.058]
MSGYDIRKLALTPAQKILSEVADRHGLTVADLRGRSRGTTIVRARQEAMYRLRAELTLSCPTVAGVINRDHTTVSHGAHAHADRHGLPKTWRTREAR